MAALGIDSTMVVGDCKSEREFEEEFKVFYEHCRCRKLSQYFSRMVHSSRDWGSEYLHPWLLMVLLAGAQPIHYMLVGIEMFPFIIVVITAMVTYFSVPIIPVVHMQTSSDDEDFVTWLFKAGVLLRVGVFVISGVLLLFPLYWLNRCVSKVDTRLLLHKADEIFPTLGFITFLARIELFAVLVSLALILFAWVAFGITLSFFMLVMVLLIYIPWHVLLPLTGFLFIFIISLLGQISSKSSGSTTSDHKDENADCKLQNLEDSKPQF